MSKKMSIKKKRTAIVLSTVAGVIALFLLVVFFPADIGTKKPTEAEKIIEEIEPAEEGKLSKAELEERVKELEEENKELKTEVEKYKILAEQTTKAVSSPTVVAPDKDDDEKDTPKYQDSSEYYDKNYKDYITEDDEDTKDKDADEDKKTSSSTSDKDNNDEDETSTSSKPSSNNPNTSDTGL